MTELNSGEAMEKVLIIDDNPGIISALELLLSLHGIETVSAVTPPAGLQLLRENPDISLVIQDMNFTADTTSGEEGRELFFAIRDIKPDLPVILLTAWTQLEMAVELVKAGAADYLGKPWDDNKLISTVKNLLELNELQEQQRKSQLQARQAREQLRQHFDLQNIIYRSDAMQKLLEMATQVARSDVAVLITGPNGAGKEKIADIVQANSPLRDGPYIKVNVGALPEELMEAELFGAEPGAYTGAGNRARQGRFETADGGTLFLDEIGELSASGQVKLLRVLQTGEFQRLGSSQTRKVKVRVISATNSDLPQQIAEGNFRQDLFYRLNVIELKLPPLCDRPEDILPLARRFLDMGPGDAKQLSPQAQSALMRYRWPGNVRELQNTMQRAAVLSQSDIIDEQTLALPAQQYTEKVDVSFEPSRELLEQTLASCNGVIAQAARELGMSRQALYRRLDKYGIPY
ncbi:DNA-binding transcriptional response regulator, NtrC family, contains REC, AAA-type ATPase, and a Fis-type DNA-binding domains [Microbulbifer donghaiensis]|uniref:DNA-binding transcriptional response regulator, NtrC family, contains REC, AAA-type ATPase, and a Fis-type DNA-binding domains n=1 Tax=Microbulbifer donghaiensis TaxID=494016 RepID=A0A1M5CTL1_9GAMM|nr:sigma-54 dependent transcriptional regulator [Microbulbifer donghaiensis]SHF58026.1 DNA-binding transcriptional response regulator, NtrC family, contains REC, AAA-type ATPase, and a Fis-type DNA-binding domains [Microbulbifer donghaiensis]